MNPEITPQIVEGLREWLGPDGIAFFTETKEEHGRVDAVFVEGGIPHAVHFREGMQVRNKLRDLTNNSWTDHQYDDLWVAAVEAALAGRGGREAGS